MKLLTYSHMHILPEVTALYCKGADVYSAYLV